MTLEDRLARLEARLRAAEDQLEIIRLLNSYGPASDSGSSDEVAKLWIEDGGYEVGGMGRLVGREQIAAMFASEDHLALVNQGVSHVTATPRITVYGDTAEAVAYSFLVRKRAEDWQIWRASINHWTLVRTGEGWRIRERYNRKLDGTPDSHAVMRRALQ